MLSHSAHPGESLKSGQTTLGKETKVRRLALADITDVKVGANSTLTLRRNNLGDANDGLFFSLIAHNRTLDLKANELQTRNKWVQYFYDRVLNQAGKRSQNGYYESVQNESDENMQRQVSHRYKAYKLKQGREDS